MTYVALRVKKLEDLIVEPMTLDRLQAPKKMRHLNYRLKEEEWLDSLAKDTLHSLLKNHIALNISNIQTG